MRSKIKLRILYKSGNEQIITCSDWRVARSNLDGELSEVSFEDCEPRGAYIGIGNIEAIWRL